MAEQLRTINLLHNICSGIGSVELDRRGFWSQDHHIWVDQQFSSIYRGLPLSERKYVEVIGDVGLSIAQLFDHQLKDGNERRMWPGEVFEAGGAERLVEAARINHSIAEPYSLLPDGLDQPSIPYSVVYTVELARLNKQLESVAALIDSPSAQKQALYLQALINAFTYTPQTVSDTQFIQTADSRWVDIAADSPFLIFAEPTEVYHDQARVVVGQNPQVVEWANQVANKNGLGPWKPFFEFRLLMRDESIYSLIQEAEIQTIRKISRSLFAKPSDKVVPVSLEFRRLLLASGNGAHPAKTAKNYPNFEQIRDKQGYKNVLYTNMIREGTLTQVIPALRTAFGDALVNQFSEQALVRGTVLRVIGHEENHPFNRFRDTPLEELKASVNGVKAIIESGEFIEEDISAVILTEIGAALHGRRRMVEARNAGDTNTQGGIEAYYKADTILFNFLKKQGCFNGLTGTDKLDFNVLKTAMIKFAEYLDNVQKGDQKATVPQVYAEYNNESVWENFLI